MPRVPAAPDIDLFTDHTLTDPYPTYAELRETGPAVWLPTHGVWAISRYRDVRHVLRNPDTYSSVDAVALTDQANQLILKGTVLATDGYDHHRLRQVLAEQLKAPAVRALEHHLTRRAHDLVQHLAERGEFDAVTDLVHPYVGDVITHQMGLPPLPAADRQELIRSAGATFNTFGPANDRYLRDAPIAEAVLDFLREHVRRETVRPGSWMAAVFDAVDHGQLSQGEAVPLMSAYTAASMDTTIRGLTNTLHHLATDPDQWHLLHTRQVHPDDAFHESLRLEAPVQAFGRRATHDTHLAGTPIAEGDQLWLLFGSTGRDHTHWGPDAGAYEVRRLGASHHLAFGTGAHGCAGNHLALLEARCLLTALANTNTQLHLTGEPQRDLNNILRGWASIPLRLTPAPPRRADPS